MSGTGFVVRFQERHFIVSARHVTTAFEQRQIRVQYRPDSSIFIPLKQAYFIEGEDTEDTDQYDLIVLSVDESMLQTSEFGDYPPYELLSIDGHTIFNPTLRFAIRGYPSHLREIKYEDKAVASHSLLIEGIYEGISRQTEVHKLQIKSANEVESFDGMSGAPVFQVSDEDDIHSNVAFAGMLLRGTPESGLVYFLEHKKIIAVLWSIVNGDVTPA
jgi:hypothetical protein